MKDTNEKRRKIGPEQVKKIFEKSGSVITDSQASQITDFVYIIAETLLGRGFKNHQTKGKIQKITDRK